MENDLKLLAHGACSSADLRSGDSWWVFIHVLIYFFLVTLLLFGLIGILLLHFKLSLWYQLTPDNSCTL